MAGEEKMNLDSFGRVQRPAVILGVLALGAGVISLYACDASTPSLDQSVAADSAVGAASQKAKVTAAPQAVPTASQLEIRAQLVPSRYTTLGAEIGAKVSRITVPEGGYFRAGQVLVVFDCSIQRAQRERSQAELAAARKTLAANRELEKLDAVGKLDLDLAASSVDRANAEVRASDAVVDKCSVTAPFAGRVTAQKVREMQYVQQGHELLEIIGSGGLQLEFIAPSAWQQRLKPNATFSVRIDETGKTYEARLVRLGARVDPVSQSIKVTSAIVGSHPDLMAGMSGVVSPQF